MNPLFKKWYPCRTNCQKSRLCNHLLSVPLARLFTDNGYLITGIIKLTVIPEPYLPETLCSGSVMWFFHRVTINDNNMITCSLIALC